MGFFEKMSVIFLLLFFFILATTDAEEGPMTIHAQSYMKEEVLREKVNYRLPNDTKPLKYLIEITTNIHDNDHNEQFKFTGKVIIDFEVLEATNQVTIHQRQLTINKVSLDGLKKSFEYVKLTEFLIISTEAMLESGSKHSLEIEYAGTLREDLKGFYRSSYDNPDTKKVA